MFYTLDPRPVINLLLVHYAQQLQLWMLSDVAGAGSRESS